MAQSSNMIQNPQANEAGRILRPVVQVAKYLEVQLQVRVVPVHELMDHAGDPVDYASNKKPLVARGIAVSR